MVFEFLESRRLLSTTIPAGYELIGHVDVPVNGTAYTSSFDLDKAHDYIVRASGTAHLDLNGRQMDAEFGGIPGKTWTDTNSSHTIDWSLFLGVSSVSGSGAGVVPTKAGWGTTYQTDHIYGTHLVGAGGPLVLKYNDDHYSDNSGMLSVNVYRNPAELQIATISHNSQTGILSNADKNQDGAYLPINNDDDNYNGIPDMNDSGAIAGEDDLLPVVLKAVPSASDAAYYTLNIPSNVRVWRNSDRSGAQVTSSDQFAAQIATTLYVEGISTGNSVLSLNWQDESGSITSADSSKIQVFGWSGPLNVPGNSIYRYTATGGAGGSYAKWINPKQGGTIITPPAAAAADIRWDSGPIVGLASFQADTGYIWDLEVNVVKVTVTAPTTPNIPAFAAGVPVDNPPAVFHNILRKFISSGTDRQQGLSWGARVTLEGPNGNRGVSHIKYGFVQNVTAYQNSGTYASGRVLASNLTSAPPTFDGLGVPWYSGTGTVGDPAHPSSEIYDNDTPTSGPPMTYQQDAAVVVGDDLLASITLNEVFTIDVCAQTVDSQNDAANVYSRHATAQWTFNGSGTIDPTTYKWTAGAAAGVRRRRTGARLRMLRNLPRPQGLRSHTSRPTQKKFQ